MIAWARIIIAWARIIIAWPRIIIAWVHIIIAWARINHFYIYFYPWPFYGPPYVFHCSTKFDKILFAA